MGAYNYADSVSIADSVLVINAGSMDSVFVLNTGTAFDIGLSECRGCDGEWEIVQMDSSRLALLSEEVINTACVDCVGGSQYHLFHFTIVAAGTSPLALKFFGHLFSVTIVGK